MKKTTAVAEKIVYNNNPMVKFPASVDVTLPAEDFYKQAKAAVRGVMTANEDKAWVDAEDKDITTEELTGGITNHILLMTCKGSKVILRTYGAFTESFIDRHKENLVLAQLSIAGFGPHFHGLIQNGRVEGYIPSETMQFEEMSDPSLFPKVAKSVAELHGFDSTALHFEDLWLFKKAKHYCQLSEGVKFTSDQTARVSALKMNTIRGELLGLVDLLKGVQAKLTSLTSPDARDLGRLCAFEQVLCHNNLLPGNILLSSAPHREVTFIDYEYAAYNFRSFDLANHFCEFGGPDFDLSLFPSEDLRTSFITHYLTAVLDRTVDPEFVDGFHDVVQAMCLTSYLLYGTWAVIQAAHSTIDFDYLAYATRRFDCMASLKKTFSEALADLEAVRVDARIPSWKLLKRNGSYVKA
jgi:ethanolamine kinase